MLKQFLASFLIATAIAGGLTSLSMAAPKNAPTFTREEAERKIAARLNETRAFAAEFEQTDTRGGSAKGKLVVERPGKLRFTYAPPSNVEVVADGRNVAIIDKKLKTQDIYPISQTPLRFLTKDKVNFDKDSKVVAFGQDEETVTLVVEESNTIGGKATVTLTFSKDTLDMKEWTVRDPQGFETAVVLSQVTTGPKATDPILFAIDRNRFKNR